MRSLVVRLISVLFLLIVLTACSDQNSEEQVDHNGHSMGPSSAMLETMWSQADQIKVALPSFLADSSAKIKDLYRLAYKNQDVIKYMPCYCGCGQHGHESNRNCFIQDFRKNGKVVWDKMAET